MSFHTGNINGSNPLFISLYNDNNQNTNKVQKQNKFNIFGNKIKIGKEKLSYKLKLNNSFVDVDK